MIILRDILASLSDRIHEGRRIVRVRLDNYFSIVELEDGCVGACMSYYRLGPNDLAAAGARLQQFLLNDPLLLRFLFHEGHDDLVVQSVAASLLSALSAPIIRAGGDESFSTHRSRPSDPAAGPRRALVVGFGGYMAALAADPRISHLHVADLGYRARRAEMDAMAGEFRRRRPNLRVSVSDGLDTMTKIREADVAFISGSTICNGTLDALLQNAGPSTRVVVQGQSASLHPAPLFRRGVALVITTLKPANLMAIADTGRLREVLEGGLPEIYLSPRSVASRATDAGWFARYAHLFAGSGYGSAPNAIYRRFLGVIDRTGRVLELGCGNGLLLRYLSDHSPHHLTPIGVDGDDARITQARESVFADGCATFITRDIRAYEFAEGPFDIIITNPLYVDRGYYEQENNRIRRLYGGGSMATFVRRCYDRLAPGGRLVLFCYAGQLAEIAPWRSALEHELAALPVSVVTNEGPAVTFFVADRP